MHPAVLFDLDGTLVDHVTAGRTAVLRWVASQVPDHQRTEEQLTAEWLRLEREHFDAYLSRRLSFQEQRRARLREFLTFLERPPCADEELDLHFSRYLNYYEQAWSAYGDAAPAVSRLTGDGVTVGVLTNGDEAQQRAKLAAVGLLAPFDCVIASSTLTAAKPAAEAFAEACARLGRPAHEVIYVGDDLHTDALAAAAAGLVGVWLNRQNQPDADPPIRTIRTLDDLQGVTAEKR